MLSAIEYIQSQIQKLDWSRQPAGLYEPIDYTLSAGGKRLRPALAVMASDMFGGNRADVLPLALALEVFHNFTLLHDDVMDSALLRRGRPTVHVRWNQNTAILSGDEMLIEAYTLLSKVPSDKLPKVLCLFNKMATEICEGQQYDVDFEKRDDVSIDEYIMMIRLKTSVLLATALQTGALVAGANETDQQALYEYGINLGLAFQIQDDWLDVYGNPTTFGKAIGGDILENKKTYLLLTALAVADAKDKAELNSLLSETAPYTDGEKQQKIEKMTALFDRSGAANLALKAVDQYTKKAMSELQSLNLSADKKQTLIDLADQLLARKK